MHILRYMMKLYSSDTLRDLKNEVWICCNIIKIVLRRSKKCLIFIQKKKKNKQTNNKQTKMRTNKNETHNFQ